MTTRLFPALLVVLASAAFAMAAEEGTASLKARVLGTDGESVKTPLITFWRDVTDVPPESPADASTPAPQEWKDRAGGRTWRLVGHGDHGTERNLPAGDYRITAALGYRAPAPLGVSEVVRLEAGQERSVTVSLQSGPALKVRIEDETGSPLDGWIALTRPDGLVVASWPISTWELWARDGEVIFAQLTPGTYTLAVRRTAMAFGDTEYVQADGAEQVVLREDQTLTVRLKAVELPEAEVERRWPWVVTGRVTGDDGRPIEGAELSVDCGSGSLFRTGHATSGADGRYLLRFRPGVGNPVTGEIRPQAASVSVRKDGFTEKNLHRHGFLWMAKEMPPEGELSGRRPVVLPGKPQEVDFVMVLAARLEGQMVDGTGKPLTGRKLNVDGKELPPASSVLRQVTTDEQGRFVVEDLPTGYTWRLHVDGGPATEYRVDQPGVKRVLLRENGNAAVLEEIAGQ